MIQVSNMNAQALTTGQALTFNNVLMKSGNCQCFNRQLPTSVKLCSKGVYEVTFNGNITGAAATPLQLAIALEGQPIASTAMQAVPAAEGDLVNVSATALIRNCCCDIDRISVVNSGANPLTVAPNASLIVKRLA